MSTNKTTFKKILSVIMVCALVVLSFASCGNSNEVQSDDLYLQKVSQYSFWKNTAETSIPEYNTYNHVHDFLDECEIIDGNAVSPDRKIRKVLFLGFDGMRADALTSVLGDAYNSQTGVSGIKEISEDGGIYLAYCGGETGTETEQTTSTSASWTSHFTGVWGTEHGIKTNDDSKSLEYKTFMLEYAEKGLSTSIAFDWEQYFDLNLKEEVKYVMDNGISMTICDIDRTTQEKLPKDTYAETIDLYNFIAPETPSKSAPYDTGMRDYVLERIENGDDVVCGIFHTPDSNGHSYGFGISTEYIGAVINCDMYAHSIIKAIKEREEKHNEEWLIVMANDHGGIGQGHGGQTLEERTTWIATNIKFNEKYYSGDYNGYSRSEADK